ncbi:MAG: translocation/assembly module TamB domain-containing protein, partial [Spirochaetia bacterium]
ETDWAVTVNQLFITGVPYYAVESASFRIAGEFNPAGGVLSGFGYSDAFSSLSGNGSVDWNLLELTGSLELAMTDELGEETYTGSVDYDGEVLSISAVFTHLPLLRAGISTVRGSLSGAIDTHGPLDSLRTRLEATLQDGRFNRDLVELSGVVNVDPALISVDDLSGRYVRTRFEGMTGELSLKSGTASLVGSMVQPNDSGEVEIGFYLLGEFSDSLASFGEVAASDFTARAVVSGLPVQSGLPEDWQFALSRVAGTLSIVGGPEDALVAVLEEDGKFSLSITDPVPLSFEATGNLRDGLIEADLINVSADVARLWRIIDSPGVTFLSGTAEGSLRIVGPLNDPDFYGTLIATNITGTVDLVADLLGPARTFLVFNEKVLSIREAVVPAGPGRARISAAVTLDRWSSDEYRVWVDTLEDDALRVVHDFGGVAIDGLAEGSIVVSGGHDTVLIEGNVIASAMYITLSDVQEAVDTGEETGDLLVDIQVTTGRGVQFLWPTDAFPIIRGYADAGETARITHQQSTGSYTVDGSVNIQSGEVFYFDRSFYIKEGRLVFAEDQSDFDPLLTVNAEIREVGREGPMRIYLVADERPLSQFTPRWRSEPPLPEAEIIALLGGKVFVGQDGSPINWSQAVMLTSDLLSQFGIIRGFESTIRDALQLDLFSIRTQLFQNLIRGRLDQADYPLDIDTSSLGKYLDNTTLFLGKYLGTDLFLELLVQLRATDQVGAPTRSVFGIAVDSELSLEWQTPFFLLQWSFFPRDPSSLFLTDNTISFAWEYSY